MGCVFVTLRPLYLRESPGTHCAGVWVGPTAGLDGCGKSRPPTGIRSPERLARSVSLHRLSYPGEIIGGEKEINIRKILQVKTVF
jgi:hypothetical protein